MRREEIMLRAHHILLKSNISERGITIHVCPFNDNIEEFYEVVWLVGHGAATKMVLERDRRKWIEKELRPLHAIVFPKN